MSEMKHSEHRTEIRMAAVFIRNVLTGHGRIVIGVSGSAWF